MFPSDDLPVMLVIVLDAMYYHNFLCKNHNALPAWHNTNINKEQNFERYIKIVAEEQNFERHIKNVAKVFFF